MPEARYAEGTPSINCRSNMPVIPASRIPLRPCPVAYQRPSSFGSRPRIGKPSGVIGRSPAQVRRTLARSSPGQSDIVALKICATPEEVTSGLKPGLLHGRTDHSLASSGENIGILMVDDGPWDVVGPWERRHLAFDRTDREAVEEAPRASRTTRHPRPRPRPQSSCRPLL